MLVEDNEVNQMLVSAMMDQWHVNGSYGPPTPIIAITANDNEATQKLCEEAGMNGLLSKPFQEIELRAVIEKWAG